MTTEAIEKLLGPKEVGEIPSVIVAQGPRRRVLRVRPSELAQWIKAREVSSL
jgi:hypothetical protein